mmetsp:Transcript_2079/g.3772  ORF Transcript_2079/g.3772 Transcript_2079/m.3772 type:complete len:3081 (+) Transcript_2079:509-9751(+)
MADSEDPDLDDQLADEEEEDLGQAVQEDLLAHIQEQRHAFDLLREEVVSGFVSNLNSQLRALNAENAPEPPSHAMGSREQAEAVVEETANVEVEGSIDTFLEFTGSQDRDRARRYLIAAEGRLEQAVNLFLSGSPLELLEAPLVTSRVRMNRNNDAGSSVLPNYLHHSRMATSDRNSGQDETSPGGHHRNSWLHQRHAGMHAGQGGGVNSATDMENALMALGGAALEDIISGGSISGSSRLSSLQTNRILDDTQRATAHVDALRSGIWDKTPEVGASCLRSVRLAVMYFEFGLPRVIAECLPMAICAGEDAMAVRFLQLLECTMRIICDGHSETVKHCGWWFIGGRRSGSRRYARNSFTEIFLQKIVMEDDLEGLQQMWLSEMFDPSWRDRKTEAEMLAGALNLGCSIEMLEMLVDPVHGCRANVNPEPDRLGSLASPLFLAATASGYKTYVQRKRNGGVKPEDKSGKQEEQDVEEDESYLQGKEAWSQLAVEVLLDSGATITDEITAAQSLMTKSARELIEAETAGTRVSKRLERKAAQIEQMPTEVIEGWWGSDARLLFRSLLRAIGLSKHDTTMHRAMEVLAMMVERFRGSPHLDAVAILGKVEYEKFMQLLQSVFTPENDDIIALLLSVRTIEALLDSTKNEDTTDANDQYLGIHAQFCLSLCRFGITCRLRDLVGTSVTVHQSESLRDICSRVVSKISTCVVDQLGLSEDTMLGRSAALLDVCDRLRAGDVSVLEHLVWMMGQGKSKKKGTHEDDGSVFDDEDDEVDSQSDQLGSGNNLLTCSTESPLAIYGDDGITAFEFEQSGLPSALLHFLLAKDVTEKSPGLAKGSRVEEERRTRIHALLSAMPPPVVSEDDAELDEEEEVKTSDDKHLATTRRESEGDIGSHDDEDEDIRQRDDEDAMVSPTAAVDMRLAAAGMEEEEDLQGFQFRFGTNGKLPRHRSSTLGRQASMTLESIQNLATTSLESIKSATKNKSIDTSAFTASALYRLINKLQRVISVHSVHNFPVLSHDSQVTSGGVRALVNAMKIHLSRDDRLDESTKTFPESKELVAQVLPLTPLFELQKQVLRSVLLSDPRYIKFCRKLVGMKVLHRLSSAPVRESSKSKDEKSAGLASPGFRSPGSRSDGGFRSPVSTPGGFGSPGRGRSSPSSHAGNRDSEHDDFNLALVVRYDPYTGAHLLQDLGGTKSTRPGRILNRKGNTQWFLMCLREYQVLERVFDPLSPEEVIEPVLEFETPSKNQSKDSLAINDCDGVENDQPSSLFKSGDKVASWWCGSETLSPGWREAKIVSVRMEDENFMYDLEHVGKSLIYDSIIRVGDSVRLIDDIDELKKMAQGHGGWTQDMPDYRGQVARVTSIRGAQVSTDGLGKYVYNLKALVKVPPLDTSASLGEEKELEVNVPERRLCTLESISSLDEKHVYSVYLIPENHPKKNVKKLAAPKVDAKNSTDEFKLNDRVEGRYAGKSRYYKGRIARVNADGTFDITYDDGDSERGVKPELVCHIGQGPGKVISYDFRKVFPNSAGRALFDALRREDSVLHTEYNFVTRGFEHQPDFYASFSKTLEAMDMGVFAKFQTKQQAEILFDRVQRCGHTSKFVTSKSRGTSTPLSAVTSPMSAVSPSDGTSSQRRIVSAYVDIFPEAVIPLVVDRDIVAAFEHLNERYGRNHQDPPPPPGHRAQVILQPQDFYEPGVRKEEGIESPYSLDISKISDPIKWISATILGKRAVSLPDDDSGSATDSESSGQSKVDLLTCVLDDGRIIWDVPQTRVRVAQRTSRVFPLETKERNSENNDGAVSASSPGEPGRQNPDGNTDVGSNQPGPVELSRQFTAFGQSTSYKRIRFSSFNEDEDELGIETFDDETEDEYEEDDILLPPRFEVDFFISKNGKDTANQNDKGNENIEQKQLENNTPILANQDGEISMFQCLFQLQNMDLAKVRSHTEWKNEYSLKWRVRCIFPGDPDYDVSQKKLKERLPWRTPRALAYDVAHRELTIDSFCRQLTRIVPDFADWAKLNLLDDITHFLDGEAPSTRSQARVNWAAITAAYSQLCQRPSCSVESQQSPAVSPIRSPTLLKKEFVHIKAIGSEAFGLHEEKLNESWKEEEEEDMLSQVMSLLEECGIESSVSGFRDTLLLLYLLYTELVPFDESADPLASAFGKSLPWRNESMSDLLHEQLSDPLSIATRCFPKWVAVFPREFSFLFRTKVRQIHLRCTALGVSRAVAWLQDEVTGYKAKKKQLAHVTLEISAMFRGVPDMARYEHLQELSDRLEDELKAIEQEHCIGQLHQDLVKVDRGALLHDAALLMRQHMRQRSELVVQFLDETGAGDGVTLDFYSSVAERLQLQEENCKIPMWISNTRENQYEEPLANSSSSRTTSSGEGDQEHTEESNVKDGSENMEKEDDESLYIVSSGGLFPQPLFPLGSVLGGGDYYNLSGSTSHALLVNTKVGSERTDEGNSLLHVSVEEDEGKDDNSRRYEDIRSKLEDDLREADDRNNRIVSRFRFLGRLMAKALLDGMNVPIPLSPEFFMLIQQRQRKTFDTLLPVSTLSLIEGSDMEVVSPSLDTVNNGGQTSGGSYGLIRKLYELNKDGDTEGLKLILEELDLRFIDPSQPQLPETSVHSAHQEGTSVSPIKNITESLDQLDLEVPGQGTSADGLLNYAENASRLGYSQADIDHALMKEGHSKLNRWKAIKGSQKTRTKIALERAELAEKAKERNAHSVASELVPGGATRRVTVANIGEYLELILLWWLGHGVERQADAFCDGLRDVLGTQGHDALLFNFSHSELRRMLCGKEEIQWKDDDPLLGFIVPMGDYTEQSLPIQMLVEALKEMNMRERAQFLNFVTSQPRVPLSGLPQVKVYPPMMECIPGLVVRLQSDADKGFKVGDIVSLVKDYSKWDDASEGPLSATESGIVTNIDGRVRVNGWWYNPNALKLVETDSHKDIPSEKYLEKSDWFKANQSVRTAKVCAQISEWKPETNTLLFHNSADMSVRRAFKPGQGIESVQDNDDTSASGSSETNATHPPLRVEKVIQEPQAIQMRPYLRPKATTCAKTLYLPKEYDSAAHLLEVFKGAFRDAKLGGIHEH